jgi:hypothetical protein
VTAMMTTVLPVLLARAFPLAAHLPMMGIAGTAIDPAIVSDGTWII